MMKRASKEEIKKFLQESESTPLGSKSNEGDALLNELWTISGEAVNAPTFKSEKAWHKFKEQHKIEEPSFSINYKFVLAATIITAILAILALALFTNQKTTTIPDPVFANAAVIYPVELPDGSTISLLEENDLIPDENFGDSYRKVVLKGDAYCEIQTDPIRPFQIQTNHGQITVLGTSFIVRQFEDYMSVQVLEGKVSISDFDSRNLNVTITQGMSARLYSEKNALSVTDSRLDKHIIILDNTKVVHALQILAEDLQLYDSTPQLVVDESADTSCVITSRWSVLNIQSILDEMALLFNAKILQESQRVHISDLSCK